MLTGNVKNRWWSKKMLYDMLFSVVIRVEDTNGANVSKKMGDGTVAKKLGELLKKEYENFAVVPVAMEQVKPDKRLHILNHIEYNEDYFLEEEANEDDDL